MKQHGRFVLLVSAMLAFSSRTSVAGQVYGFGPSGIYSIDSATGATTLVSDPLVFHAGASRSAVPGVFYITSGVNLWTVDLFGNSNLVGPLINGTTDLAFDSSAGLYGIDPSGVYAIGGAFVGGAAGVNRGHYLRSRWWNLRGEQL